MPISQSLLQQGHVSFVDVKRYEVIDGGRVE